MQITPHFLKKEFDCKDLAQTPYPSKWIDNRLFPLCQILEKIRAKVGRPLIINSGYRTKAYNTILPGAAKRSLHMQGMAADFRCGKVKGKSSVSARRLYKVIEQMIKDGEIPDGGLGSYSNHVHYDTGPKGRRW